MPGLSVAKLWRPLDRVGLYVPGGKAPLFSTLLMLAIPARVAGVGELVVVTPPRADGGLDPAIALAAELCGIERDLGGRRRAGDRRAGVRRRRDSGGRPHLRAGQCLGRGGQGAGRVDARRPRRSTCPPDRAN